jgi:hypothetical protein
LVIDLELHCVTRVRQGSRFAAPSYVWSQLCVDADRLQLRKENIETFQKPGGLNISLLPQLVKDVFWLCQNLNERYLWFDRLCIVQDNGLSKHAQISAMYAIYSAAAFTIIIALDDVNHLGLSGAPNNPRRLRIHDETGLFGISLSSFTSLLMNLPATSVAGRSMNACYLRDACLSRTTRCTLHALKSLSKKILVASH